MDRAFALRHYRLFLKSLPPKNRHLNNHLYKSSISKNFNISNDDNFLKDFQLYLDSCKQYHVNFLDYSFQKYSKTKALLERYNIAVPRDMKNQIRNVSRMVGFELPKAFLKK